MKSHNRILMVMATCFLGACSTVFVSDEDIAGVYAIGDNKQGVDTLYLSADGTYTHVFVSKKGKEYKSQGVWVLEANDQTSMSQKLLVRDYIPHFSEMQYVVGGSRDPIGWPMSVRKSFIGRGLYIQVLVDGGPTYYKCNVVSGPQT